MFFNCSSASPGSKGSECQKSCNTLDMACVSYLNACKGVGLAYVILNQYASFSVSVQHKTRHFFK